MRYFDKLSKNYSPSNFNFIHSFIKQKESNIFKKVLKKYNSKKKITAIDIGSGAGYYSEILYSKGIKNITCLDTSIRMLKQIKIKKAKLVNKNIFQFRSKNKFDLIIVMGLIEFVSKYKNFFKQTTKLAKKDTVIIILMPSKNLFSFFYYIFHLMNGNLIHLYNPKKLVNYLNFLGWNILNYNKIFPQSTLIVAQLENG
jgi:2-polyprenyl-6-hydroxyphenyl methylase/3-demethylubiquinone-9 3-methyltransferase